MWLGSLARARHSFRRMLVRYGLKVPVSLSYKQIKQYYLDGVKSASWRGARTKTWVGSACLRPHLSQLGSFQIESIHA